VLRFSQRLSSHGAWRFAVYIRSVVRIFWIGSQRAWIQKNAPLSSSSPRPVLFSQTFMVITSCKMDVVHLLLSRYSPVSLSSDVILWYCGHGNILIVLKRNNIDCLKPELIWIIFKNSVRTAKKTILHHCKGNMVDAVQGNSRCL
jgi:hypothetical protein